MNYYVRRSEKWTIEPEETLLDRESAERLEYTRMETPVGKRSFAYLFFFIVCVLSIFVGRVIYLQVERADMYMSLAVQNKTRNYPILAHRGIIYDRYMSPLVENIPSFDIVTIPADLPRNKDERERMIRELAGLVGVLEEELLLEFTRLKLAEINPMVVRENVQRELALLLETRLDDFPGIELKKNAVRKYSDGESLAHVLGYIGRVSPTELSDNRTFSPIDYAGKVGVELSYDKYLRGVNGVLEREVDAAARLKKEEQVTEETTGMNLVLTIDAGLQKKMTEVLTRTLENTPDATGIAAVALEPKTGEILSLVSLPSFDNNMFSDATAREEFKRRGQSSGSPFFNRAVSGLYPPGSSIKPFMALAALQEGIVTERTKVNSTGAVVIRSPYNPDVSTSFRDWKEGGHGLVNVYRAIAESVNTYFFAIGGGYGDIEGLGIDRIKQYLVSFGFGMPTGVDIKEETTGVVPDRAWKEKALSERWVLGDTYNVSIGQGNLLVSPLQLARAYAALANSGTLLKPFIVRSVADADKNAIHEYKPEITSEELVSKEHFSVIRSALREAVTDGTARRLADLKVAVAGKTGTAQAGSNKTHAWFASFAPYNKPEIVLIILAENGGEGSQVAVPAAHEIYQWYFSER